MFEIIVQSYIFASTTFANTKNRHYDSYWKHNQEQVRRTGTIRYLVRERVMLRPHQCVQHLQAREHRHSTPCEDFHNTET